VAEMDGKIVGHIAFSPVTINGENQGWYGLGPVSVLPELQRQGIGSKLIREGITLICALLQSVANKKSKDMKVVDQPFHEDFSEMKPSGS